VEQLVLALLESEAKASASSQVMMSSRHYPSGSGYSQRVPRQMTGVHLAAYFGLREAMIALLKSGPDLNSKDTYGQTLLEWATQNGRLAVVELLLANDGVDLDSKETKRGQTPLSLAAKHGHDAVVKLLLSKDSIDPDSKDNDGRTPLSWGAEKGHKAAVKLLLAEFSVGPDSKDNDDRTPLSWAAEQGQERVVKLLLAKDSVNPDSRAKYGRPPLVWPAEKAQRELMELLLTEGQTSLLWTVVKGYDAVLKLLPDVNRKDNNGWIPLSWAAEKGHVALVKLLLAKDGVNPDSKDYEGRTPLSLAAEKGHEVLVKLLLAKHGVDRDSKDTQYGQTPAIMGDDERTRVSGETATREGRRRRELKGQLLFDTAVVGRSEQA
jgi:ankyrin repeat protein